MPRPTPAGCCRSCNRCAATESVFGLGAYSGGGDADRRRRLDGGAGLHRPAPERRALRTVPRRRAGTRRWRCSASCGASTRRSRGSISRPASRPACRFKATRSAIPCRRRPAHGGGAEGRGRNPLRTLTAAYCRCVLNQSKIRAPSQATTPSCAEQFGKGALARGRCGAARRTDTDGRRSP